MRALILNGALEGDEGLALIHDTVHATLAAGGWRVDGEVLRDLTIAYCQGCFECWVKTPGLCKTRDAAHGVARAIIRSDLLILLSPVTFGGYSSVLKKALDRSICLVSPFFTTIDGEVHHKARYARYPRLAGIGVLSEPDADQERIFTTLVGRNALNLHVPAHAAGIVYRDQPAAQVRDLVWRLTAQLFAPRKDVA